jgi:large subunit ribosomal protein L14e
MYEVGRLCVKIAGRDARMKCVIVEELDKFYVMIDGQTRRRKCNTAHLEPLDKVFDIKKGASHKEVVDALKSEGIEVIEKTVKEEKAPQEKPKKKTDQKPAKSQEKPKKKAVKKASSKEDKDSE